MSHTRNTRSPHNLRNSVWIVLAAMTVAATPARAAVQTVRLSASRLTVLNDGRDYTEIIAEIRDSGGNLVPDGTQVNFTTNLGVFGSSSSAPTRAGAARIRLTSPQKGVATVQATVVGATERLDIQFTDDPEATFQGNGYVAIQSDDALLYSASDRIVEAAGKKRPEADKRFPGAHVRYRNIEIFADRLQLDCTENSVRATGAVTLKRGSKRLTCARLFYSLTSGEGFAITEIDQRLRPAKIKGADLAVEQLTTAIPDRFFTLEDIGASQLIITARQILLFPGEKLQFKRPRIYQEGALLVSMPFYQLSLFSSQLFTEQILSVGTQGLGINLPLYYDMSPTSTGIFSIRHGERSGRSNFSTRPGWSLDMTQQYNSLGSDNRFAGAFGLTGINRSDWGIRWNHSQQFGSDARGSVFLDFPRHRSVFGSTNLSKQFGAYYVGVNLAGNHSFSGYSASGLNSHIYVESLPKKVSRTGYMYALGATAGYAFGRAGSYSNQAVTQGVQARFYSSPFRLSNQTTVTNSLTVGNVWGTGINTGASALASLNLTHTMKNANLNVGYDFTKQPVFFTEGGQHRLNMSLAANGGTKWTLFTYASAMLDSKSMSLMSDLSYELLPRWRFSLAATFQRFLGGQYRDYELGIGRTIGGREVRLFYSTFNHRIFFDIQASRF